MSDIFEQIECQNISQINSDKMSVLICHGGDHSKKAIGIHGTSTSPRSPRFTWKRALVPSSSLGVAGGRKAFRVTIPGGGLVLGVPR